MDALSARGAAMVGQKASVGMLFLGGVGSGGTDLLMNVVNAHPAVFVPGEVPFLPAIADRFPPAVAPDQVPTVLEALRELDVYRTLEHHHWDNFVADSKDPVQLGPPPEPIDGEVSLARIYQWVLGVPDSKRWTGNKTPTNTENIDRLARAFPGARFAIIVRDVRDVALSWRDRWGRDELMTADKWDRRLARGREHLAALDPHQWIVVRYEDLLDDLEATARRLCDFLDLDFDDRMLAFHEHVTKSIGGQENRGRALVRNNSEKWRTAMKPHLVRRVEEIAWEGMGAHGYSPSLAQGPRSLTAVERLHGRGRDVAAVVMGTNTKQHPNRLRAHVRRIQLHIRQRIFHRDLTV